MLDLAMIFSRKNMVRNGVVQLKKKDIDEKIKRWFRLTLFFEEEFYIFFITLMLFYITQLFFCACLKGYCTIFFYFNIIFTSWFCYHHTLPLISTIKNWHVSCYCRIKSSLTYILVPENFYKFYFWSPCFTFLTKKSFNLKFFWSSYFIINTI
jgi:hypothetical protein